MDNSLIKLNQAVTKDNWYKANNQLLTKIIREFLYEEILLTEFTKGAAGNYLHKLVVSESLYYTFTAQRRIFGNWCIDATSVKRWENKQSTPSPSVSQFITDTYALIGIQGLTLGHLLRELNNTLVADCHLYHQASLTCAELVTVPNHELEGFMHGHPWFVINKGRMGFSYHDYLQHAPEMRCPTRLMWIAVNKKRAIYSAVETLNFNSLIEQELSIDDRNHFKQLLKAKHLQSDDYYFMPIQPWQWKNQLITIFADDIVHENIVYLGESSDEYLPTQSIRTFTNTSQCNKFQVKLPLSIFNTAVYRGLPGERTRMAPQLTAWLRKKYDADSFFQTQNRLILLGEVASIDFPHAVYTDLPSIPYQYKELLGVIWRENVNSYLREDESAITMAALIHLDHQAKPFVCALIEKSGLSVANWLELFFQAVIPSLLHWLYRYGVVFSPHGENTLLVLDKQYRPVGLVIKDFIDDVNLSDRNLPEINDMPQDLREVLLKVTDEQITQFIHTGLFVVLYRYLSDILQTYANYPEADFWQQVHDTIVAYQASFPELQTRFQQFALLGESFKKLCLNRLRLLSVGYADYSDRPKVDLFGVVPNPTNINVLKAWKQNEPEYG